MSYPKSRGSTTYVQNVGTNREIAPGANLIRNARGRVSTNPGTLVTSGTISTAGVYFVNASSASVNITLPSATVLGSGAEIAIIRTDSVAAHTVTILPTGGQTIDGATSAVLAYQWQVIDMFSNGSNWVAGYSSVQDLVDTNFASLANQDLVIWNGTAFVNFAKGANSTVLFMAGGVLTWQSTSTDWLTQYVLLAGRAGGQTIIGGTGAGDDLTLRSSSDATKGTIFVGSPKLIEVEEPTSKIGFFAANPVVQQTVGAITNNVTSGGSTGVIADYTDLTVYANDSSAIRNDIYQLALAVQQLATAVRNLGLAA